MNVLKPLDEIVQDLKFAARYAYRTRLTTLTMVLVLSLGIGVNAALFTVIYSVTGKPSPGIPPHDALVRLRTLGMSYPLLQDIAKRRDMFDLTAAAREESTILEAGADAGGSLRGDVVFVTNDYFRVLGVQLEKGRLPADSGADRRPEHVAVIDFVLWRDRFGEREDIVGQRMKVNSVPVTIVGVAPRGFGGPNGSGGRRVWMPLGAASTVVTMPTGFHESYDFIGFDHGIARIRDGVTLEQASGAVQAAAAQAATRMKQSPRRERHVMVDGRMTTFTPVMQDVVPLRVYNQNVGDDSEMYKVIGMFTVLTLLVLLVTCTNVASLLAGAGLTRRREIAVRLSLGAPRTRIVRQLVTESVLVALMASAVGLALLWGALRFMGNLSPDVAFSPDWPAILFTAALAILTAVGFALSPALHATRMSVAEALKNTATNVASKSRLQRSFVVAQITLTQPLLVLLGVMVAAIVSDAQRFHRNPLGDRILRLSYTWLDQRSYDLPPQTPGGAKQLSPRAVQMNAVAERLRATPGVAAVIASGDYQSSTLYDVHPADGGLPDSKDFRVWTEGVHPGYLELMGWPLIAGRDFTPQEIESEARVMIIRSDLARQLWGSASPVGKRLRRLPPPLPPGEKAGRPMDTLDVTIVGVVDAKRAGPSHRPGSQGGSETTFEPGRGTGYMLYVRTTGPAEPFIPTVRAISKETAPRLLLEGVNTIAKQQDSQRNSLIMASAVAGTCGAIMLGLACIGLYAVIAFAVGQRTREIGIRIALGQGDASVVGMFMKSGMILCALGVLIGIPLTIVGLKLGTVVLPIGQIPRQVPAIIGVVIVVALVSAVAIFIPARRAVTVDPLVALRAE